MPPVIVLGCAGMKCAAPRKFNGAVLYDCSADRILYEKKVHMQYVYQLFEMAHRAGIYIQTYSKSEVLAETHSKELDHYIKHTKMSYKLSPDVAMIIEDEPYKVLLINLDDRKILEEIQEANASLQMFL